MLRCMFPHMVVPGPRRFYSSSADSKFGTNQEELKLLFILLSLCVCVLVYIHIYAHARSSGCTEEDKALELTRKLGVQVHRSMVVLSHSPMRCLAAEYSGKRVMVLGSSAKQIAEEDLGLRDTVSAG